MSGTSRSQCQAFCESPGEPRYPLARCGLPLPVDAKALSFLHLDIPSRQKRNHAIPNRCFSLRS